MGKADSQIPTAVRRAVDERDARRCVRCGMAGREQHHRTRRREAGHAISNLVLLCGSCHRHVHANPTEAKATGFIIPPWGEQTSLTMPVREFTGQWLLLDDDAGIAYSTAPCLDYQATAL